MINARLMAIFPGQPGEAGCLQSPFLTLLELRMMKVVVTTGAIRRAKLQSSSPPPTNHHPNTEHNIEQKYTSIDVASVYREMFMLQSYCFHIFAKFTLCTKLLKH